MREKFTEKAACEGCRRFHPREHLKRSEGKLWCVEHFPVAIGPGTRSEEKPHAVR